MSEFVVTSYMLSWWEKEGKVEILNEMWWYVKFFKSLQNPQTGPYDHKFNLYRDKIQMCVLCCALNVIRGFGGFATFQFSQTKFLVSFVNQIDKTSSLREPSRYD